MFDCVSERVDIRCVISILLLNLLDWLERMADFAWKNSKSSVCSASSTRRNVTGLLRASGNSSRWWRTGLATENNLQWIPCERCSWISFLPQTRGGPRLSLIMLCLQLILPYLLYRLCLAPQFWGGILESVLFPALSSGNTSLYYLREEHSILVSVDSAL